jgi:uroporphyrin-III C-methyltransferase
VTVYLVGAGPGDPELLTRRGAALLARADVVLFDRLVDGRVLSLASPDAVLEDVGKSPGDPGATAQRAINRRLVELGRAHGVVVRLKGGDPFLFGRGYEELAALRAAGVPAEVVPGVSSAFGVPAAAGIPVTLRDVASAVTVVAGHDVASGTVDWSRLGDAAHTLVVLMGVAERASIRDALLGAGRDRATPCAILERGTTTSARTTVTTLDALHVPDVASPAVLVIGEVAALARGGTSTAPGEEGDVARVSSYAPAVRGGATGAPDASGTPPSDASGTRSWTPSRSPTSATIDATAITPAIT